MLGLVVKLKQCLRHFWCSLSCCKICSAFHIVRSSRVLTCSTCVFIWNIFENRKSAMEMLKTEKRRLKLLNVQFSQTVGLNQAKTRTPFLREWDIFIWNRCRLYHLISVSIWPSTSIFFFQKMSYASFQAETSSELTNKQSLPLRGIRVGKMIQLFKRKAISDSSKTHLDLTWWLCSWLTLNTNYQEAVSLTVNLVCATYITRQAS